MEVKSARLKDWGLVFMCWVLPGSGLAPPGLRASTEPSVPRVPPLLRAATAPAPWTCSESPCQGLRLAAH